MKRTVLLVGATSQVGYRLLPMLVAAGYRVLAVSRHGRPGWAEGQDRVDWLRPGDIGLDEGLPLCLVSAGPLPLAERIARRVSPQQVVAVSSASVLFKQDSRNRAERSQIRDIIHAEQALQALCRERATPLTILRPTLIYGSGLDNSLCRVARWIRRFGWFPVAGQGRGLRQPIMANDVARLMLESITDPGGRSGVFAVAGAEQICYREMIRAVYTALEKPPRLISLPTGLYAVLLRLASILRPAAGLHAELATRQNRDLLVDTAPMRETFTFQPGKFALRAEHLIPPGKP